MAGAWRGETPSTKKEADVEETAGYEERFSLGLEDVASYREFFTAEEWDEMEASGWVLKEGWDDPSTRPQQSHRVFIGFPPGEHEGNQDRFELECDVCGHVGAAETIDEAQAIARLHEAFVARLVENWSVER